MALLNHDIEYFKQGKLENEKFWKRLSGKPDFTNSCVLDVGCGHGRLCIDTALSGAKKVVGIDLNSRLIEFARENLERNYYDLSNKIEFHNISLGDLYDGVQFDYILSKDSFEHIIDLDLLLQEMKKRLKKGGRIYVGFGPLYRSYFGDHKKTKAKIPWFHLIIPESVLLRRLNRNRDKKIKSIEELGLNKYRLKDYKRLFKESSLSILYFKVNCSDHILLKLFKLISKIPGLEEYFSKNIYCILEKG